MAEKTFSTVDLLPVYLIEQVREKGKYQRNSVTLTPSSPLMLHPTPPPMLLYMPTSLVFSDEAVAGRAMMCSSFSPDVVPCFIALKLAGTDILGILSEVFDGLTTLKITGTNCRDLLSKVFACMGFGSATRIGEVSEGEGERPFQQGCLVLLTIVNV